MESKNCRKRRDTEGGNSRSVELLKLADTIVCITTPVLLAPRLILRSEFGMDCN
jgi:hypothetical protein